MTNQNFQAFQDSFFGVQDENSRFRLDGLYVENFWYYDTEYYPIESGSIFFRGRNGSGKSIITSALLPLLIDGNTRPNRIDPFGSNTRTFADMVLGQEEVGSRTNETAYIGVCYKQPSTGKTIYCGIGAHATKVSINKWYFISEDINPFDSYSSFRVFDDNVIGGQLVRTYFDKSKLKKLAQQHKEVTFTDSQSTYAEVVNQKIFGFKTQEDFTRYLELLIKIKNPRVVDENFVKGISDVLRESFPVLSSKSIDALNASIEMIEEKEEKLATYTEQLNALDKINRKFAAYRNKILAEVSIAYKEKHNETEELTKTIEKTKKEIQKTENEIEKTTARLSKIAEEINFYEKRKLELSDHDIFKIRKNIELLHAEKTKLSNEIDQLKKELTRTTNSIQTLNGNLSKNKNSLNEKENDMRSILSSLSDDEGLADIHLGFDFVREATTDIESDNYSLKPWADALAVFKKNLKDIRAKENDIFSKTLKITNQKQSLESLTIEILSNEMELEKTAAQFEAKIEDSVQDIVDVFKFTDEPLIKIYELTDELEAYQEIGFDLSASQKLLHDLISELQTPIRLDILEKNRKIDSNKDLINITEKDIIALKKDDGLQPILTKVQSEKIATLKGNGVPFKFFYELVDFKEGVPQEVQCHVERYLYEQHYLFALFTEDGSAIPNELYTIGKQSFASNIGGVLQPIGNLSVKYGIADILSSIPYNNELHQFTDGETTFVSTVVSYEDSLKLGFIGEENRRIRTKDLIEQLEAKIELLEIENETLTIDAEFLEEQIQTLDENKSSVLSILDAIGAEQKSVEKITHTIENLENRKSAETKKLIEMENEIEPLRGVINNLRNEIRLTIEVNDAENKVDTISTALSSLQNLHFQLNSLKESIASEEKFLLLQLTSLKEAESKILGKDIDFELLIQKISELEHQLSLTNEEEIEAEINTVVSKLQTLPAERSVLDKALGIAEQKSISLKEQLVEREENYAILLPISEALFELASIEYGKKLHELPFEGDSLTMEIIDSIIEWDSNTVKNSKTKPKTSTDLFDALTKTYNEIHGSLNDYSPSLSLVYNEPSQDVDLTSIEKFTHSNIFEIKEDKGVLVSPFILEEKIRLNFDILTQMITDKEAEMINNYLINDIDSEIKRRIDDIELFIERLNRNMADIKTSVQIKIDWQPIKRKGNAVYGVDDVIKLIGNSITRSQKDTEKLRAFYQEKIDYVKKTHRDPNIDSELKQLIEETLDYRTWFDFKILFRQSRDHKFQELTSSLFSSKSGGEKGLSTYIPLFSCVNVMLDNASPNAPRLIALDEAFNRIDEKNIEAMFDLISLYEFDYVMNSEKIWATYDGVQDLNIMEILREVTEDSVTVMKYRWRNQILEESFI